MGKLTAAQRKVIARFKAIGGAAYLGPGVRKDTQTINLAQEMRQISAFFGKKEAERVRKLFKKYNVTSKAVWCSQVTLRNLQLLNLVEAVDDIGLWRLTQDPPKIL